MPATLRHAALMLVLVLLLAQFAQPEPVPVWEVANRYARIYREWAELRNQRVMSPGTISAPEMLAWLKVKAANRQLEKQVDAEYRGE